MSSLKQNVLQPKKRQDVRQRQKQLLQQLPPIRKLHLEKGRLTDLVRLYPDMKRTFDAPELLPEAVIASAMVRRRMELLLFRADDSARRAMRS